MVALREFIFKWLIQMQTINQINTDYKDPGLPKILFTPSLKPHITLNYIKHTVCAMSTAKILAGFNECESSPQNSEKVPFSKTLNPTAQILKACEQCVLVPVSSGQQHTAWLNTAASVWIIIGKKGRDLTASAVWEQRVSQQPVSGTADELEQSQLHSLCHILPLHTRTNTHTHTMEVSLTSTRRYI